MCFVCFLAICISFSVYIFLLSSSKLPLIHNMDFIILIINALLVVNAGDIFSSSLFIFEFLVSHRTHNWIYIHLSLFLFIDFICFIFRGSPSLVQNLKHNYSIFSSISHLRFYVVVCLCVCVRMV